MPLTQSEVNQFGYRLGVLTHSLSSLESVIRWALLLIDTPSKRTSVRRFSTLKAGEQIADTWMSRFVYLSDLIKEYNSRATSAVKPTLDTTIYDLRNGLAHGRMTGDGSTMFLTHFYKGSDGQVCVRRNDKLDEPWFTSQIDKVFAAYEVVMRRISELDTSTPATERVPE